LSSCSSFISLTLKNWSKLFAFSKHSNISLYLRSKSPELAFRVVLTKDNFTDLPQIVELASSQGVRRVYVRTVNEGESNFTGKLSVKAEQHPLWYEKLQEAKQIAQQDEIDLSIEFDPDDLVSPPPPRAQELGQEPEAVQQEPEQDPICSIPFTEMVVFGNGIVSTCCNYFDFQFKPPEDRIGLLENLQDNSLRGIWERGFEKLRNSMFTGDLTRTCDVCSQDMKAHRAEMDSVVFISKDNNSSSF